jgi:hypothetical protein
MILSFSRSIVTVMIVTSQVRCIVPPAADHPA